ncbi:MAG TPA: recombinase family protein [Candidatus Tumulicola sp.]
MATLREEGHSLRAVAQRLNDDGHKDKTRSDCSWMATQVMCVLRRPV